MTPVAGASSTNPTSAPTRALVDHRHSRSTGLTLAPQTVTV
ncbi:hypothetical protein [Actinokineospora globicatena]|nr:hypothetical protein [Actinokineospora globicatena]